MKNSAFEIRAYGDSALLVIADPSLADIDLAVSALSGILTGNEKLSGCADILASGGILNIVYSPGIVSFREIVSCVKKEIRKYEKESLTGGKQ